RHDRIERAHVRIAVEFEAVHRYPALHPDTYGGDFAFTTTPVRGDPHPTAPLHPAAVDTESVAHRDQGLLQSTDVGHHVDRIRQPDNRVAYELSRTVPSDPATPVHVHNGCAVRRPVLGFGALTSRVYRGVFQ